jgi:nucleotide-binding universal stress UspA family protein
VVGLDDGVRNEVETGAQALLDEAVASVAAAHPGGPVAVTGELVRGEAGPTLLRAAEGSAMLVVGARGRRGLMALLLGSVSTNVVSHATVPVVVVPAPPASEAN